MRETARWTLPLSFRSCVPFREIRLCDVDGVGDFFGVPGSAFGCGPAGGSLAALTVAGQGEDRGVQAGQRGIRAGAAVAAVPAAGVGGDVGADEAEHGGERDEAGVEAGGSGGAVVTVKVTSRAMVSGSRSACLSPVSRRRRARIPSDSCSMTSSEPSGRVRMVLSGTDFAPFLTRQGQVSAAGGEPQEPVHGE